ncbi:MAG: LacI family DNA-binding transcriptional regulator, partial [Elusimicrobia bacterium]|nr:LacI family DNA-binding transcriptional regulator [Elusimicrobiota bacterium]
MNSINNIKKNKARKLKARLILRSVKVKDIALGCGVSSAAVSQVLSGRSKSDRIYKEIKRLCGR